MKLETNKVISSLCYFSIFFAGFIFPIAVYFIVDNDEVKQHAKRALLSHVLPLSSFLIIVVFFPFISFDGAFVLSMIMILVFGILSLTVVIWNVIKGIVVLRD